ncbi:hypothetical protein N9Z47_04120 [bacterium]|nr:hypothetical protein [bacterium]
MDNPFSSPQNKPVGGSVSRSPIRVMFLICIGVGVFASGMVYIGDALMWPLFNRRQGYFGTEFLSDFLYAINDPYAIHIVAFLWFLYAVIPTAVLLFFFWLRFVER